jgi:hypothetical protein
MKIQFVVTTATSKVWNPTRLGCQTPANLSRSQSIAFAFAFASVCRYVHVVGIA